MNSTTSPSNRTSKLTKRQFVAGALIALILVALGAAAYYSFEPTTAGATGSSIDGIKPMPVSVLTVHSVDSISQPRAFTGMVRARSRSDLGFELTGTVKAIYVDEGDRVKVGQLLAELDVQSIQARRQATMANLAQAKSVLNELMAGARRETIAASRSDVASSKSIAERTRLDLQRRERLFESNAISQEEYDRALYNAKAANSSLQAATERLNELENGTRPEKVTAQKSIVKSLEAAVAEIDVSISKSQLLAPFAGSITQRYTDPGSIIAMSAPVIRLVEQDQLEAWIGIPISLASQIQVGEVQSVVIAGQTFGADVAAKLDELDPVTRTRTIVLALNQSASLHVVTGELCEITIQETVDTKGIWIPTSALAKGVRGLWSVYVVEKDDSGHLISQKRDVEVVKTQPNRVLVRGTLLDSEKIVFDGVHRIGNHQLVEIVTDKSDEFQESYQDTFTDK